jgi:hypothetical protein
MSTERIEVPASPEVFAEWYARFAAANSDEGKTFAELRVMWKCGDRLVRQYLREAQKAGILVTGSRVSVDLSGRRCRIPVYSFLLPKAKPKAKK